MSAQGGESKVFKKVGQVAQEGVAALAKNPNTQQVVQAAQEGMSALAKNSNTKKAIQTAKEAWAHAGELVDDPRATAAFEKVKQQAQHAKNIVAEKLNSPEAKEITDRIKAVVQKNTDRAKHFLGDAKNFIGKASDNGAAAIADRGLNLLNKASHRYVQLQAFRQIVQERTGMLKKRIQNALVSEVETGIGEIYNLSLQGQEEQFKKEELIPALLVPINLAFIKAYDCFVLFLYLPIFLAYAIVMAAYDTGDCNIETSGGLSNINHLYYVKMSVDGVTLLMTLHNFGRIVFLQKKEPEDDEENEDEKKSLQPDNSASGIGGLSKLQERGAVLMEMLQDYDKYGVCPIKNTRSVFLIVSNIIDFSLTFQAFSFVKKNADPCSGNKLFQLTLALIPIYFTLFIPRLLLALYSSFMLAIDSCCIRTYIYSKAKEFDSKSGVKVAEFFLDSILFRKAYLGKEEENNKEKREKAARKKELRKKLDKRNQLIQELEALDNELRTEKEYKNALKTEERLSGLAGSFVKKATTQFHDLQKGLQKGLAAQQAAQSSNSLGEEKGSVELKEIKVTK
eukprot:jgi/Bigna1/143241/aug1.77_g17949